MVACALLAVFALLVLSGIGYLLGRSVTSAPITSWEVILGGWITFLVGHSITVVVRARLVAAQVSSEKPIPVPETVFLVADGAVVATAIIMMTIGTTRMLSQPRWKLLIALLALTLQLGLAFFVYWFLTFTVHMGLGGRI